MRRLLILLAVAVLMGGFSFVATARAASPVVYVENTSTAVPQADLEAALPAFQLAVTRDLAAAWGTDASLTTNPAVHADMRVELSDDADCLGCLGYHDVIDGVPTGKVFAQTSKYFNESWQLVFTHELFELLVDPWINRLAEWNSRMWLVEVADPCESGLYAYFIDGVAISDFITPRWYNRDLPGPFDFTRHFRREGQIGRHGYASYRDVHAFGGWSQVFGARGPERGASL